VDTVYASVSYRLAGNFENLELTGAANSRGVGNELANEITGNGGDNRLLGLQGNDRLGGGAGDDVLRGGRNNDVLNGDTGDDVLRGGQGRDILNGGDGDGILIGGVGKDKMTGGEGADIFVFNRVPFTAPTTGRADIITDFDTSMDLIDLRGLINVPFPSAALVFIGTGAFLNAPNEVRAEVKSTTTEVQIDLDGDTIADMVIVLDGVLQLQETNFLML